MLVYLHGYLESLKNIKNGHYDNFQYINQLIAKHSDDELIRMHRDFKDKYDREMMEKYFEVQEKESSQGFSHNPQDNYDSDSRDDFYNPDLDLDQQHPDFYV